MPAAPVLLWFRDDLRLDDNPALTAAAAAGPVVALFVLDPETAPPGGAARWWLGHSHAALAADLSARGIPFLLEAGPARALVPEAVRRIGAKAVFWNRRYTAPAVAIDTELKATLRAAGLRVDSRAANLLFEPWTVTTKAGTPFRVFTPFWRAARALDPPRAPLPVPAGLTGVTGLASSGTPESLGLLPVRPDWAAGLRATWTPGEAGARQRLTDFLAHGLARYAEARDRPAAEAVSRLSPHLRFGEISPHRIWHAVGLRADADPAAATGATKFLSELGWREFSWHLLHQQPDLATRNFQPRFDAFPWVEPGPELAAWQQGRTGYPIVDAGMRELWQTGWMHNRVRMIAASFLIKDLRLDWRLGEAWFRDTLVDADPAANPASWQWVAGSGADAAPYFRIFNPVLQGEKFDPDGAYVRRFVPELARLPDRWLHRPFEAPAAVLAAAGVRPGTSYPLPIVDHGRARDAALAAFATLPPA